MNPNPQRQQHSKCYDRKGLLDEQDYKPHKDSSEESLQVHLSSQEFGSWHGRREVRFLQHPFCARHGAGALLWSAFPERVVIYYSFHASFKVALKNIQHQQDRRPKGDGALCNFIFPSILPDHHSVPSMRTRSSEGSHLPEAKEQIIGWAGISCQVCPLSLPVYLLGHSSPL